MGVPSTPFPFLSVCPLQNGLSIVRFGPFTLSDVGRAMKQLLQRANCLFVRSRAHASTHASKRKGSPARTHACTHVRMRAHILSTYHRCIPTSSYAHMHTHISSNQTVLFCAAISAIPHDMHFMHVHAQAHAHAHAHIRSQAQI